MLSKDAPAPLHHPSRALRVPPSSCWRRTSAAYPHVLANQCRRLPPCHCEPARTLVWQSRTRSNVSAGTRRFPRQSSAAALCRAQPPKAALSAEQCALPRNDESIVLANQRRRLYIVIANQFSNWCGNLDRPPAAGVATEGNALGCNLGCRCTNIQS